MTPLYLTLYTSYV